MKNRSQLTAHPMTAIPVFLSDDTGKKGMTPKSAKMPKLAAISPIPTRNPLSLGRKGAGPASG